MPLTASKNYVIGITVDSNGVGTFAFFNLPANQLLAFDGSSNMAGVLQTAFASAAQGVLAGTALQPAGSGSALTGITAGQVSGLGVQMAADTGWTANTGAGTKTTALPNYAGGLITSTMQTALNTVSAALGTNLNTMDSQVKALTDKVAAMETALAAGKLPNA
jgi:hypothetical protein